MGFRLTEKNLKRAGCDYWDDVEVVRWPCVEAFFAAHGDDELHLFTGQAACGYRDAVYGPDAFLLFGRESRGLDQAIIDARADRLPAHPHARGRPFPQPFQCRRHSCLRGSGPARLSGVGVDGDLRADPVPAHGGHRLQHSGQVPAPAVVCRSCRSPSARCSRWRCPPSSSGASIRSFCSSCSSPRCTSTSRAMWIPAPCGKTAGDIASLSVGLVLRHRRCLRGDAARAFARRAPGGCLRARRRHGIYRCRGRHGADPRPAGSAAVTRRCSRARPCSTM